MLALAVESVKYAAKYTPNVEFSAEDASRSDLDFVCTVFEAVIKAGATTLNFPDTTGYALPDEFGAKITYLVKNIPNIDKAVLSIHCHNDLGLAEAMAHDRLNAPSTAWVKEPATLQWKKLLWQSEPGRTS